MSRAWYEQMLAECVVNRRDVGEAFRGNKICFSRDVEEEVEGKILRREPTIEDIANRKAQCKELMIRLFGNEMSVSAREGAGRLQTIQQEISQQRGYIWTIFAKLKIAFAVAATATIVRKMKEDASQTLDFDDVQKNGRPAPYSPSLYSKNWNPDHEAAGTYYLRSLLALQIARDLDIEVTIP